VLLTSLKSYLPVPVRRALRLTRSVTNRLIVWSQVATRISGQKAEDRAILVRAITWSPITVWHDLDRWQFPMVEHDCTVVSKGAGMFQVRAHTDDLFHVLPGQEPGVERAIRNALRTGDTFVDAGSNIGYYTIVASRLVGEKGQVIACEMMPITAEVLRQHVAINGAGNVTVVEGALADSEGQTITASFPLGKFGQASIARASEGRTVTVQTRTLENILSDVPEVHMMKMDLEGAELGALRGLGDAILKVRAIVFENRDSPDVVQFLEDSGFSVRRIDGNNALAQRRSDRQ
jgi:FkbM family methyltransferase